MYHHSVATFVILSLFSFWSLVHAFPKVDLTTVGSCAARTLTTTAVQTRMVEQIYTITTTVVQSHACYTYTSTTFPYSGTNCGTTTFTPGNCTIAQCVQLTTKTIVVPCSDSCCTATPTVTVAGPCASCQVGCSTITSFLTTTSGACNTKL